MRLRTSSWKPGEPGNREYECFRQIMTDDVNEPIRGAFEAGEDQKRVHKLILFKY